MGHRHLYSPSEMFDGDHEQNWSYVQPNQHFVHPGRDSNSDNGSMFYPMENISLDEVPVTSNWNPATRSNGYGSSSLTVDTPPHRPDPSSSTHDDFLHSSTTGAFCPLSENYPLHASSSYDRQSFQVVDGNFGDLTMGSGGATHKRKSPGIPPVCERGSTSRNCNSGSTLEQPMSSELRQEKQSIDSQYLPWEKSNVNPPYHGDGLSIRSDGSLRNVRSRSAVDLEPSLATTILPSNHSHSYSTSHVSNQSGIVDLSNQGSSSVTRDWSQMNIPPGHGQLFPETCSFSHETNHFVIGSSASSTSLDMGAYHHDFASRIPRLPQNFHGNSTQSVRGIRSHYSHRSNPASRASSSMRVGHVVPPDFRLHAMTESFTARHSRPLSSSGWRGSERNGRSRVANERYRSLAAAAALHDRFSSEGFMIFDRASLYGSRSSFDQHRDMRMDVDNMSYEELLALGERIGNVSTGLSEDLISKCLTEIIYCSSEQSQDEGRCVICLEEYKDRDDVGALRACGHDYHVSCIRKWLSMKNVCPICKASLVDDVQGK